MFNNKIFLGWTIILNDILCGSGNFTEKYFGIELSRTNFYTCPESSDISPLYGLVNLNFNPFYSSVVLFILLISIFLYFYFKLEIKDMVITSFEKPT